MPRILQKKEKKNVQFETWFANMHVWCTTCQTLQFDTGLPFSLVAVISITRQVMQSKWKGGTTFYDYNVPYRGVMGIKLMHGPQKNEHNKHTRNRLSLKDTSECNELTFRLINHPGINPTPYLMLNFTIYHHRPLTHLNFLRNLISSVLSGYFLSESVDFLWFEYSNVYN